jgi:hypothetical protein
LPPLQRYGHRAEGQKGGLNGYTNKHPRHPYSNSGAGGNLAGNGTGRHDERRELMPKKIAKVFILCPAAEQKQLITEHCFGDCGKIWFGGLTFEGYAFVPCTHENCPYEDKVEDFQATAKVGGIKRNVWLRKLKGGDNAEKKV